MNIEHAYLESVGFTIDSRSDIVYVFRYSLGGGLYTNVYYHTNEDNYTLNSRHTRYTFDELIIELSSMFFYINIKSFKLFKRSNTIKTILTTDKSAYGN